MKTKIQPLVVAFALALQAVEASAVTFTTNTTIGPGDTTYDGQDIIVSGCALTVNGPHAFTSLLLSNGGILTHSPATNGETHHRLELTIAQAVTVDATSRIDASGKGYGAGLGPGAGTNHNIAGSGAGHGGPGTRNYADTGGGPAYALADVHAPTSWGSGGGNGGPARGGAGRGRRRRRARGH